MNVTIKAQNLVQGLIRKKFSGKKKFLNSYANYISLFISKPACIFMHSEKQLSKLKF